MSHLYEVRGSEIYPTIHNDLYSYISSPVFEVRGNEVYPTIHNDQYNYTSSPVFEIRGDEVLSTTWNPHFPYGEPAALVTTRHDGAGAVGSNDISFDGIAYAAAAGAGFFAALKTYERVKGRRDMKARKRTDPTESLAASAPLGWYHIHGELRYWNGVMWTENRTSAPVAAYQQPFFAPTVAAAPTNGVLVTLVWIVAVSTAGYMLPWAIAVTRGTSNSTAVGLVSFFLGWTVVGWFVALVMACTGQRTTLIQRRV